MDGRERKVLQAVDSLADDIVDFTCRLVAEPSTLGNEASVLKVMEREFVTLGHSPQRVEISPSRLADHPGFAPVPWNYEGRYNLVSVRPADGEGGKSALFNGHLDVVSPAPLHCWDSDPYAPFVRDGWLYGRGSGDMKAGVAAMTYAVKAIETAGFGLAAPVTLETVIEEECSGNGALACRAAGYDAEAILIPEPIGPNILTAQVGVCWFEVFLSGVPTHVQSARSGVNAIEKCFVIIQALRGLEEELNSEPHLAFLDTPHPVNLNVGVISGGDWPSTVPASASVKFRLGFLPGISFPDIRRRVEQTLDRVAAGDPWLAANPPKVDFYGFRSEGHHIGSAFPAFDLLSHCQTELGGAPPSTVVSTATTDLRAFVQNGNSQATCFGPVAENVHAGNERVNIESIRHTAKVYSLFLARWCKLME